MRRLAIAVGVSWLLVGCSAIQERASTANLRHPCGNVWNICPEQTPGLRTISAVLNGRN